jgi:hypothetical protein
VNGYRRLLRCAALPITDRRWAAPLSAVALGFGLFVGVAIGPGAAGTFGTGAAQIIEIPGSGGEAASVEGDKENRSQATAGAGDGHSASLGSSPSTGTASSSFIPLGEPETLGSGEGTEASAPKDKSSPPEKTPEPEKEAITGVVVHANSAAGSYAVAEPGGALTAIHAPTAPQLGTKVEVPIRPLANGTLAEAGTRTRLGRQMRAQLSGIVTYVDPTPAAPAYTVSKRGVSLLVHVHPDPAGLAPTLPVVGAFASVEVDIEELQPADLAALSDTPASSDEQAASEGASATSTSAEPLAATPPSCAPDPTQPPLPPIEPPAVLWQRNIDAEGAPFTYSDFEGIVIAVCPEEGKLRVSADDIRESGEDLLFDVPPKIDMTRLRVGDSILASATIAADGALSLTGLASDERTKGADDLETAQGDLAER